MKPMAALLSLALFTSLAAPASAEEKAGKATPLFADDSTLDITISGPIDEIARKAARSTDPKSAQIEAAGEAHAIQLSARGKSRRRRDVCRFPPLRVELDAKADETSLFYRQSGLKLVTHCQNRESHDRYLLGEYAVYRLYNIVTPESLRVRLLNVTYTDEGKVIATRPGFFIEDADDAARRLGRKEVDTGDLPVSAIDRDDAARFALFQYLIGNTDWAMAVGPDPTDCCHNSKLLGESKSAREALTPVPYDFDNAGLVDAPYAVPNKALGTRNVRERVYRGFCAFNVLIPAEAARMRELRPAMEAEIASIPGLDAKTKDKMLRYLASGFGDIADTGAIERNLLRNCR